MSLGGPTKGVSGSSALPGWSYQSNAGNDPGTAGTPAPVTPAAAPAISPLDPRATQQWLKGLPNGPGGFNQPGRFLNTLYDIRGNPTRDPYVQMMAGYGPSSAYASNPYYTAAMGGYGYGGAPNLRGPNPANLASTNPYLADIFKLLPTTNPRFSGY